MLPLIICIIQSPVPCDSRINQWSRAEEDPIITGIWLLFLKLYFDDGKILKTLQMVGLA